MLHSLLSLDTRLFFFFNSFIANPVFDAVFPLVTNGRFWILPGILAALVFIWLQRRKALVVIALAVITVSVSDPVCNKVIKPQFHRVRPCNELSGITAGRFLTGRKYSDSFPSSHAMNVFAQAMLLSLLYRKKMVWITAFVFAALIGFSRIYVGVHYPLDVLGGAVGGVMVGLVVYWGYAVVMRRWNPKILRLN